MEEARSELGRRLDRERMPAHPDPEFVQYCDPWERPCTFGRWAELWSARHREHDRVELELPAGDMWWKIGDTTIGEVHVSTVWLGMNHRFGNGPPLIYETMVFGGALDQEQERYEAREAAAAGHERMVRLVQTEIDVTQ